MLNKVLLKSQKESEKPAQRKALFRTMCNFKGKCCKMVIDNGSTNNLVSTEMVEKLSLKKNKHPIPYKVSWLHKGHQILVSEQWKFDLQVGTYKKKYVMLFPWMCVMFFWGDLGSLTRKYCTMVGGTAIVLIRMD